MIVLRPYQEAAVARVCAAIDGQPILVAPTGSGKTVMGVAVAQRVASRTLWVAHRRELIHQAAESVERSGGRAGIILAGEREDRDAPFQVASVQTLARRPIPEADLLVIDEAHHATSSSYRRLIGKFPRRVGLTATPFRLDGTGLRKAGFNDIVVAAWTDDLCVDGTLHEPGVFAGPAPNLKGIRKVAGDYHLGQLGAAVGGTALCGKIVETWQKRAAGRRTVAFAVNIAHAETIAASFTAAGVAAEVVTGTTPKVERAAVLARLAAGVTLVVVNVGVLTEGWDLPALEVAIIARPTASRCLHLQQIGRVMRACDGKESAIVLDHAGNTHAHGLVTERLVYSLDGKVRKANGEAPVKTCPECTAIVAAGCMTCPECGHEFEREDKTQETDVELLPVGHADTFADRQRRWHSMAVAALSIVRAQNGDGFFGWDEKTTGKAHAIASGRYFARYGEWPLSIRGRLIDPVVATPGEWEELRAGWRRIGVAKGWEASKCEWFAKKCEAEAKSRGNRAGAA
jgi:DNA repair protein RadD